MTTDEDKKFQLYPREWDYDDGEWTLHNSDPFFKFYEPEWFEKQLCKDWQLVGAMRHIQGKEVQFVKCLHHEGDCWQIMLIEDGVLEVFSELCDTQLKNRIELQRDQLKTQFPDKDDEFISSAAIKNATKEWERDLLGHNKHGEIVSANALKKKLDSAKPSSPFYHPFEGFEKVDAPIVPMSWTIQDLIPDKSIGAIYGERESLKSFLALDLALSIATGTPFNGAATRQGSVLYFAPEGSTGIGIRRDAWKAQNEWENKFVPFYSRGGSFSFTSQKDRDYLADLLAFAHEFAPRLVIFDTLGQSLGDADENSASDINKIARFLNDLKLAHDCSFLWVDHSGHESKRARVSSAKGGALDFEYFVNRKGDHIEVTNTKMKDAPRSKPFTMEAVHCNGSLVLNHVAPNPSHADLLIKIITEASDHCEKQLRATFYDKTTASTQEAKQKAFQRSVGKLLEDGTIVKVEVGQSTKLVLKTPSGHTHPPL